MPSSSLVTSNVARARTKLPGSGFWVPLREGKASTLTSPRSRQGGVPGLRNQFQKKKEKQNQRDKSFSLFLFRSDISRDDQQVLSLANFHAVIGCESQLSQAANSACGPPRATKRSS